MGRGGNQVAAQMETRVERLAGAPNIQAHCEAILRLFQGREPHPDLVYRGIDDMVAQIGQVFTPTPWKSHRGHGYRLGQVKECFRNAFALSTRHKELTYAEGLAYSGYFPVHHAWCVTQDGRVVDPTWSEDRFEKAENEVWEYAGIPFTEEFLFKTAGRRKIYGILDEPYIYMKNLPASAIAKLNIPS